MSYNGRWLWKLFSRMEFRERDRENIEQNRKWENSRETPQKRRKLNKILKVELKVSSKWKKSKSFQSKISLLFSLWGCRFYLIVIWQTDRRQILDVSYSKRILMRIVKFKKIRIWIFFCCLPRLFSYKMKRYESLILVPCLYSLETFEQQNILINNF